MIILQHKLSNINGCFMSGAMRHQCAMCRQRADGPGGRGSVSPLPSRLLLLRARPLGSVWTLPARSDARPGSTPHAPLFIFAHALI